MNTDKFRASRQVHVANTDRSVSNRSNSLVQISEQQPREQVSLRRAGETERVATRIDDSLLDISLAGGSRGGRVKGTILFSTECDADTVESRD